MRGKKFKREIYPLFLLALSGSFYLFGSLQSALDTFCIGVIIYVSFYLLRLIDPLKQNYQRFDNIFKLVRDILLTFFVVFNLIPQLSQLEAIMNIEQIKLILSALLMIVLGNYLPTFKRNWFIGIKNPWTMSSEQVWNRTHRLGGKLFVLAGVLSLIHIMMTGIIWMLFASVLTASIWVTIYSYWLFLKLDRGDKIEIEKNGFQKRRIILGIIILIVVSASVFIPILRNIANLPVPISLEQIQSFVLTQPTYRSFELDKEFFGTDQGIYAGIELEGQMVDLIVILFDTTELARGSFKKYNAANTGHIVTGKINVNLPGTSFWTGKTKGKKYIMWEKKNWLIILSGENTEIVNQLSEELKEYLSI